MDQDASAEMEVLAAGYRLLDEKRHRLRAQKEDHLKQLIQTYVIDQENDQNDIKNKELALREFEAKYHEELRIRREALQTALQRPATRKRKHEADVQKLNQDLLDIKRLKHSNASPQVSPVSFC